MKAITSRITQFVPVDKHKPILGTYYLDQCGNVVTFPSRVKPKSENLPYVADIELSLVDDIPNIHISEIEHIISTLKSNIDNIVDPVSKAKYDGYISALNYIVTYGSKIDPWGDYLDDMEIENIYYEE